MSNDKLNSILLVEDEEDIRAILQIALESMGGYTLKSCEGGLEALELAPHFKPDLILLDMMMPQMDGLETLKRLKINPKTQNIPVIFLTAKVQTDEINEYFTQGAIGVITKPFDPLKISQNILDIWNNK